MGEDDSDEAENDKVIDIADHVEPKSLKNKPPAVLLNETTFSWFKGDQHTGIHIKKAIEDHDFEAFVQIVEMYKSLPKKATLPEELLLWIIEEDQVEMLDLFVRWTGLGIVIKLPKQETDQDLELSHTESKLYLGLDVNGKKRFDLARKHDPNASTSTRQFPMLWQACRLNALGVMEYLAGSRPLAAYRFYMSSTSDDRAKQLKKVAEFEKVLPEWLGWTVDQLLGDTPLVAAVIGGKLPTVKWLFDNASKLMASALGVR